MADKKTDCGCLMPILPCLYNLNPEDAVRKEHSNHIDKQLAKEKAAFDRTHRLLLLGAGESGKSTIIKQMQLLHIDNFSDAVRIQRRDDIRNNLLDAIVSILLAMPKISPPEKLDSAEHERMAKWILDHATKQDFDYPQLFYEYTQTLWLHDKGIYRTFDRSHEYHLIDSAKYFFKRIEVIAKSDYLPTDQDILRCRVLTTGIFELAFRVNNVNFRLIDVGGQRDERRKWFLCFNDVTAIIFVTACSSYNLMLREDNSKNRLRESLELFKVVWNNRWLARISVILFLNKQDLFRQKILSGKHKLEDYFPDYREYVLNPLKGSRVANGCANEHPEVLKAKYFIKEKFEKISFDSHPGHNLFPHFTCAIDSENIKMVFNDCRDTIQKKYLIDFHLM